jgi:catechol 2,3-dioxygenase-like lactoylglutathione lyase family enzyme
MIGYVTIGTKSMDKACTFYGELLAEVGGKQLFGMDRIKFFGTGTDAPMLAVCVPYDEQAQHPGNGTMVAIPAKGLEQITRLYNKAIELGATCDGAPGERLPGMFSGAYVRDPDGNKLCFYELTMV